MQLKNLDYFENSRRATYANRAYAIANPKGWIAYGENVWGFTASDGPADIDIHNIRSTLRFNAYGARGGGILDTNDDGTIAPTAAASSIAFAPKIVLPALQQMVKD